jgi:formate hydrogenlyase subunit 3/multisubunit Na+/H+ antiporter MnhD subunit
MLLTRPARGLTMLAHPPQLDYRSPHGHGPRPIHPASFASGALAAVPAGIVAGFACVALGDVSAGTSFKTQEVIWTVVAVLFYIAAAAAVAGAVAFVVRGKRLELPFRRTPRRVFLLGLLCGLCIVLGLLGVASSGSAAMSEYNGRHPSHRVHPTTR